MRTILRNTLSLLLALVLLSTGVLAEYAATGRVSVSALRLRKEPGTNAAVLATLSQNTAVTVLHEEQIYNDSGAWYKVSYGSLTGYMSAEYLDVEATDLNDEGRNTAAIVKNGVTTTRVNFRSEASLQAAVIQVLPKGAVLEITSASGEWYAAVYRGKAGYVSAEYISESKDAVQAAPLQSVYTYTGKSTTARDREILAEAAALSVTTEQQRLLLDIAAAVLGTPYAYGSSGTKSFDCSGFTSYVYKQSGLSIQRTALDQYRLNGTPVNAAAALQPGDLVFFRDTNVSRNAVSHVGMYIGQGLFIHAGSGSSGAGRCVKVSDLSAGYYKRVFVCGKRVL